MNQEYLPLLYYLHHGQHMEDLPFWLNLAENQTGPILELGCGTGRILLPLTMAGYDVCGLDLDLRMLAFLIGQWPNVNRNPPVFQADMRHFHLASQFSLILLPCNTLSTFSPQSRQDVFERVAAHLSPNGLFSASLPNPKLLMDLPPESESEVEDIFYLPPDNEPVQVSSAWERTADYFTVIWHYDHLLPDGRIERMTLKTRHTLSPVESYQAGLRQAGFRVLTIYGDFDYSPYTSASTNLIIVAARPD